MRGRLATGIAAMVVMVFAGDTRMAPAAEPGRLAAFAARQGLRDRVCFAMADGHIDRGEQYAILTRAKAVLKPEEYEAFRRAIDRLSASSHAAAQRPFNGQFSGTPSAAGPQIRPLAKASSSPVIPAAAILPDKVASADEAR